MGRLASCVENSAISSATALVLSTKLMNDEACVFSVRTSAQVRPPIYAFIISLTCGVLVARPLVFLSKQEEDKYVYVNG